MTPRFRRRGSVTRLQINDTPVDEGRLRMISPLSLGIEEAQAEAGVGFLPYLRWNRSTRPAVSISFCLPVKKGWQLEQISIWISFLVERVVQFAPQAQLTWHKL